MTYLNINSFIFVSVKDKKWCQDITFLSFYPPPSVTDQGWSKWVETLEAIDYDLHILLKLPHNVFWSQVSGGCGYVLRANKYLTL